MRALAILAGLAFGVAACGDDSGGGSGTYSCDFTKNGDHGCTDYSWSGGVYSTASWAAACTGEGGTAGTGCTHSGAVGACKFTSTSGAVTVYTSNWFYTGTAQSLQTACTAAGATWVAP